MVNQRAEGLDPQGSQEKTSPVHSLELLKHILCLLEYLIKDQELNLGMWKTTLEANFKPTVQAIINCGINKGDALAPLLFCMGLKHLAMDINYEVEQL